MTERDMWLEQAIENIKAGPTGGFTPPDGDTTGTLDCPRCGEVMEVFEDEHVYAFQCDVCELHGSYSKQQEIPL